MQEQAMDGDIEYLLPCAEGLLATALALMTAHAQASTEKRRCVLAVEVAAILLELTQTPTLVPQFRAVLEKVRTHWEHMRERDDAHAVGADQLWHASPALLQ